MKRKALAITCSSHGYGNLRSNSAADGDKYNWYLSLYSTKPRRCDTGIQGWSHQRTGRRRSYFDEQNAQGFQHLFSTIINSFVSIIDWFLQMQLLLFRQLQVLTFRFLYFCYWIRCCTWTGWFRQAEIFELSQTLLPLISRQQCSMNFPLRMQNGLLYCSAEANSLSGRYSKKLNLKTSDIHVNIMHSLTSNDLSSVATTATDASDVIYVLTDNTVISTEITNICLRQSSGNSRRRYPADAVLRHLPSAII